MSIAGVLKAQLPIEVIYVLSALLFFLGSLFLLPMIRLPAAANAPETSHRRTKADRFYAQGFATHLKGAPVAPFSFFARRAPLPHPCAPVDSVVHRQGPRIAQEFSSLSGGPS